MAASHVLVPWGTLKGVMGTAAQISTSVRPRPPTAVTKSTDVVQTPPDLTRAVVTVDLLAMAIHVQIRMSVHLEAPISVNRRASTISVATRALASGATH